MRLSPINYWDLLSGIAGILFALAFAPFDYSFLASVALCILFASWQNTSPGRALLRGYLFGLGAFGLGVSWVYISIHSFGGANAFSSGLLTSFFFGFWALFPALAGCVSVKIRQVTPISSMTVMPVVWLLVEYLRGYLVLNGFPWLQVGYAQLETPLAGYIPVFGIYGAGFVASLTVTLLLSLWQQRNWRVAVVLITLWTIGAYLKTVQWTQPIGAPIPVALIQGNISQDQKWLPDNKINTLGLYKTLTEQNWDAKIIVWPETAIPAYLSEVQEHFL